MEKYHLWVYYEVPSPYEMGIDYKKDAQIRDIMEGNQETGSGSGFGKRDLSFYVLGENKLTGYKLELEGNGFEVKVYDMKDKLID